jgi:hypothetical protein
MVYIMSTVVCVYEHELVIPMFGQPPMSAAAAAKPDEASSPDGLVDESEYFKTSFNKAADLYNY